MRRAISLIVGLVLVFGTTLPGLGHVHAASHHEGGGALHLDHVHPGADAASHHPATEPGLDPVPDHNDDDAVSLQATGSEAAPKRTLPCLAASAFGIDRPTPSIPDALDCSRRQPRDPPPASEPPSRAPPA